MSTNPEYSGLARHLSAQVRLSFALEQAHAKAENPGLVQLKYRFVFQPHLKGSLQQYICQGIRFIFASGHGTFKDVPGWTLQPHMVNQLTGYCNAYRTPAFTCKSFLP